MLSSQREPFEHNVLQFLQIELETGITFARLAVGKNTEEARQRNRQNARKAYDTAKHFLTKFSDEDPSEQYNLLTQMTTLKDLLLQLGVRRIRTQDLGLASLV